MEKYTHIFIKASAKPEKYKARSRPGSETLIPDRDREEHSTKLLRRFDELWAERELIKAQRSAQSIPTSSGTYLAFTGAIGADLITKSLENMSAGVRLLNIKETSINGQKQIQAVVYIPSGKEGYFINKIADYKDKEKDLESGKPKNSPLVNSIEDVSIALLEALWTDDKSLIPSEDSKWCEVWVNVSAEKNKILADLTRFYSTLTSCNIEYRTGPIIFPERAVLLINANKQQLIELMLQSDLLAEFRTGQEAAGFWMEETSIEQQGWVQNFLGRLQLDTKSSVKICILDSGVNSGHQLLQPILNDSDVLTVNPAWGSHDHFNGHGHGTLMAGLAGYGNLVDFPKKTDSEFSHRSWLKLS